MQGWHAKKYANKVGMMHDSNGQHMVYIYLRVEHPIQAFCYIYYGIRSPFFWL